MVQVLFLTRIQKYEIRTSLLLVVQTIIDHETSKDHITAAQTNKSAEVIMQSNVGHYCSGCRYIGHFQQPC